jgi:hypothetical protein
MVSPPLCPNSRRGQIVENGLEMSKLQTRAGTPAPQCGTGVLARQIAEAARKGPNSRARISEPAVLRRQTPKARELFPGGQLGVSPYRVGYSTEPN